ncbi:helix-turn-helix transcriptional regulator [Deinococcus aluminii]|uniref:HTH cro/C1-type domain-containing protein n=1 Tax=Deinococcus aluminii TaxID=1656885 RepID=A0ABP9XEP7_9DEIO
MNAVGARVREARFQQDPQWSLEDLSQALLQNGGLELTPATLSKIERGRRSVYDYEVVAFCRAFKVEPRWLLGMDDR